MSVTGTVEAPSASLLMTPVCEWPMHPQCRDTIQRDLDCMERWVCAKLWKFNKVKYKDLPLCWVISNMDTG